MSFTFKFRGTIGAALPEIKAVLGVGKIIAPIIGLLRPLTLIFDAIALAQKIILFVFMLPFLALAALVELVVDVIKAIFQGLAGFILLFKGLAVDAAISKYHYTGTVGQMAAAFKGYFAGGIPTGNAGPGQTVYAVFFVAHGTAAAGGLNDLFGPAPAVPPLPEDPPVPANTLTAVTLELAGEKQVVGWTNSVGVTETTYEIWIEDATTHEQVDTLEVKNETGTSHTLALHQSGFVDGKDYVAVVKMGPTTVKSDKKTYTAPTVVADPVPPPPPANPPVPVPGSANITFLGREAIDVSFPFLGMLGGFIAGLEQPLTDFQNLIIETVGRALDRKRAIELMIEQWDKWARDIDKMLARFQHMVDSFLAFSVHVSGFFELGEILIYRFDGPVGSLGDQMGATLTADGGLKDTAGGMDIGVDVTVLVSEDPATTAILKFITGG
jgi:hypothetical protein